MKPQFMQSCARAIIAVLTATILLSACGSKPDASDIGPFLSNFQCNRLVLKDVKKVDGMEAPDKQYQVKYTFVAEIKGGPKAAAELWSKMGILENEAARLYKANRDDSGAISAVGNQITALIDCDSVIGHSWIRELYVGIERDFEQNRKPILVPYAMEFQGVLQMMKAESGWVPTNNRSAPSRVGVIQDKTLELAPPPLVASNTEAPTSSPTGVLAATAKAGDVTPVVPQGPAQAAAPTSNTPDAKIVAEATGGKFNATKGKYFDSTCNDSLDYEAKVIDLNGDGQPEVFTSVDGICLGGMAGVYMDLFIKDTSGRWKSQFGFSGIYTVLKSKNQGYPDIEVGGPGNCSPVWRWTGQQYAIYKKCP